MGYSIIYCVLRIFLLGHLSHDCAHAFLEATLTEATTNFEQIESLASVRPSVVCLVALARLLIADGGVRHDDCNALSQQQQQPGMDGRGRWEGGGEKQCSLEEGGRRGTLGRRSSSLVARTWVGWAATAAPPPAAAAAAAVKRRDLMVGPSSPPSFLPSFLPLPRSVAINELTACCTRAAHNRRWQTL